MILNPWVIGMYVSLLGMAALYSYAITIGVQIVRRWDVRSMEEEQLTLERKSFLASTIIQYGLGIQVLSVIFFYMTVESLAEVIPGAMCATGALNANQYGFPALYVKMLACLVCAIWIAIHHIDSKLEDYSLTPLKYRFLFSLAPLLVADLLLQFLYFLNLNPNVITSCCGVVFEIEGEGFGSSLASLPPGPMMLALYALGPALLTGGYLIWRRRPGLGNYLYSFFALVLFVVSVLAVISFIAPYIYEMPSLHCPFNIMRGEYKHIGYAIYFTMFGAAFFSLIPGLSELLKGKGLQMHSAVAALQRRTLKLSLILWGAFYVICSLPILLFETRSGGYLFA